MHLVLLVLQLVVELVVLKHSAQQLVGTLPVVLQLLELAQLF